MIVRQYIPWVILTLLVLTAPILFLYAGMLDQIPQLMDPGNAPIWNNRVMGLMGKTLLVGFAVAGLNTILSVPLTLLFERYVFPLKKIWMVVLLVPILIPPYIYAIGWIYILGDEGWLNQLLISTYHLKEAPFSIYGFWGTVFVLTAWLFPLNFLLIRASTQQSRTYQDAARLVAGKLRTFFRITLPMIWPGIAAGIVFSFILAASSYNVPGALRLNVLPTEIFVRFGAFFDHDQAALVSVPMVILLLVLLFYALRTLDRKNRYAVQDESFTMSALSRTRRGWLFIFLSLFLVVVLILPLSSLLIKAGSYQTYIDALANAGSQILNSIGMAFLGSILVCLTGFLVSFVSFNSRTNVRQWIHFLVFIPFILPATVYAIALIRFWNLPVFGPWVVGAGPVILLGYFKLLPLPYFIGLVVLSKIPSGFVEAAYVQGARPGQIIRKILIPLSRKGILGVLFLTLIFCLAELDSTLLIHPPGFESLPVRIFSLLHYGANDMVAALSVLQVLMVAVIVLVTWPWIRTVLFDEMLYIRTPEKTS